MTTLTSNITTNLNKSKFDLFNEVCRNSTSQEQSTFQKFQSRDLEKTIFAQYLSTIPFSFEITVHPPSPVPNDSIEHRFNRLDSHLNHRRRKNNRCFFVVLPENSQSSKNHFHSLLYLPPDYLKNTSDFEFIQFLKTQVKRVFPSLKKSSKNTIEIKRIYFPKSHQSDSWHSEFRQSFSRQSQLLHDLPFRQYRERYVCYPYKNNESFDYMFFQNSDDKIRHIETHSTHFLKNEILTQIYQEMTDKYFHSQIANIVLLPHEKNDVGLCFTEHMFPKIRRIEIESNKIQTIEEEMRRSNANH